MIEVCSSAVAGRWFALSAQTPHVGLLTRAWQGFTHLMLGMVTFGLTLGDVDPRRPCVVFVYRRDTAQPVAEFTYTHLGEASMHVPDLWERLQSANVFDFCRDLGIPMEAVAGVGEEQSQDQDTIWMEVRR